jgi:DNA-binding transcriptional ArsR family regulator
MYHPMITKGELLMSEMFVQKEPSLNPNTITYEERQRQIQNEERQQKEEWERNKKSPYKNFIQVNKDFYKAEDWLMAKSPIAYRIFKFLINGMDGYNAVVCSYKVLQENFEISQVTVARSIKLLKEKGYIAVFKSGTSNVYTLNDKIVWNSWGTNYAYSKFPANIILSISEQEEATKRKIKMIKHKEITLDEE